MEMMTRREALASSVGTAVALGIGTKASAATAGCCPGAGEMYKDGKMDFAAVKAAYFEMFERFKYPVPEILRTDEFWVADFVQGDILKLGMGGIFWVNESGKYGSHGHGKYDGEFSDTPFGYLGHEIYLLPGQTLPEHSHLGGDEGFGPKMEAWQVRYGDVHFYGEYQSDEGEVSISELPESARPWGYGEDWFKSKYAIRRTAQSGRPYLLKDPESWHGQTAGKHGAIVTEYATYHNHVMFSKPDMIFACTGHES